MFTAIATAGFDAKCYCMLLPFCSRFTQSICNAAFPCYLGIAIGLGALVWYTLLVNKRTFAEFALNRAIVQSLNERHQLWQNIRISEILLPTVLANSAMYITVIVLSVIDLILYAPPMEGMVLNVPDARMLLLLSCNVFGTMHCCAHPCIVFYMCPKLRENVWRCGNTVVIPIPKNPMGIPNGIHRGEEGRWVEYRVNPEQNDEILNNVWGSVRRN